MPPRFGVSDAELIARAHTVGEVSPTAKEFVDLLLDQCIAARQAWRRIEKDNLRLAQTELGGLT